MTNIYFVIASSRSAVKKGARMRNNPWNVPFPVSSMRPVSFAPVFRSHTSHPYSKSQLWWHEPRHFTHKSSAWRCRLGLSPGSPGSPGPGSNSQSRPRLQLSRGESWDSQVWHLLYSWNRRTAAYPVVNICVAINCFLTGVYTILYRLNWMQSLIKLHFHPPKPTLASGL